MTRSRLRSMAACGAAVLLAAADMPRQASQSYLPPGGIDITSIIPPAPVPGDVRYEADREVFRRTRALKETPRWMIATRDVSERMADMLDDFSCAAGVPLSPDRLPRLVRLLVAVSADTARVNNLAKERYRRARPFTIDPGPICQPAAEVLGSYDYPSGHTTRAWTWGIVLAKVLPGRAEAIMMRARAFGESRIVCGVHNASAVEAGRLSAAITMTLIEQNRMFRNDLRAARHELANLRRSGGAGGAKCTAEAQLLLPSVVR